MEPKLKRIHTTIKKQGQLTSSSSTFVKRNISLYGGKKVIPAPMTIAGRLLKVGDVTPKSNITVVGEAPDGFGKQINWHPDDKGLAVVIFLNAGDPYGVMITGVRATDTIEFVTATGIASFAEDTENKGVGAIIGIVAIGANITAAAFGAPEAIPLIDAAAKYAESQFQEKKVKTKRRDSFGVDPGTGHKARQEGGVIISLPKGVTTSNFWSGNSDHKERWIKEPGIRDFEHYPDHVKTKGGIFLQDTTNNKHKTGFDGDIIIGTWDYNFQDNFGYYRLHVLLKRGSDQSPIIN